MLQVHELHRVYRVQKMLMAELGKKQVSLYTYVPSEAVVAVADARARIWSSASTSDTSHSSHVSNLHHQSAPELNSEYSSLNPWSEHVKGLDLEQPAEEYTCRGGATSMEEKTTTMMDKEKRRSVKGSFSWPDDGSEIELALSIGCSSSSSSDKKKRRGVRFLASGAALVQWHAAGERRPRAGATEGFMCLTVKLTSETLEERTAHDGDCRRMKLNPLRRSLCNGFKTDS
ncbi:hypothetical protein GW17_00038956 [Ensete ventricosum]|nr:hypothetical protein GW17_00038956 [Ensete ventricosum]